MKLEDLKTIPFEKEVKAKFRKVDGQWETEWRTVQFMVLDAYPKTMLNPTINGRSMGLMFDVVACEAGVFTDHNGTQMMVLPLLEPELLRQGYDNKDLVTRLHDAGLAQKDMSSLGRVFVELYQLQVEPIVYDVLLKEIEKETK